MNRVVKTCLAKDPEDRFQTAHDAKLQLQWVAEGGSQAGLPAPVVARRKNREKLAWAVAAAAILAAALATVGYLRRAPAAAQKSAPSSCRPRSRSSTSRGQLRIADGFARRAVCDLRGQGRRRQADPVAPLARRARRQADRRDRRARRSRSGRPTAAFSRSSPTASSRRSTFPGRPRCRSATPPTAAADPGTARASFSFRRTRRRLSSGCPRRAARRSRRRRSTRPAARRRTAGRRSSRTGVTFSTWPARTRPARRASRTRSTSERSTRTRRRCSCRRARTSSTPRDTCSTCASASCSRSGSTRVPAAGRGGRSRRRRPAVRPRATSAASSRPRRTAFSSTRSARRARWRPRLTWIDRAGKPIGEPFGEPAEYSSLSLSPDDAKHIAAGDQRSLDRSRLHLAHRRARRPDAAHVRRSFRVARPVARRQPRRLRELEQAGRQRDPRQVRGRLGTGDTVFHGDRPGSRTTGLRTAATSPCSCASARA